MAVGTAIVTGFAAFKADRAQSKAEDQQEEANKASARAASLKNARSRRAQVATARRLRAQTVAQGESQGISGSSVVAGAAGSVQTQAASNISFLQQLEGLDSQRLDAQNAANRSLGRASTFQAIGRFANTGAGQEGIQKIGSFFKG